MPDVVPPPNHFRSLVRRTALYPDHYAWYLLASALDVMVTYAILAYFNGWEVNVLAARLVDRFDHWGLILLKFSSVIVVIAVCELVGRVRPATGRRVATAAIVVGALPVGLGLLQLALWTGVGGGEP